MDLFSFIAVLQLGAAFIILFKGASERSNQYLSILAIALIALLLLEHHEQLRVTSAVDMLLLLPIVIGLLGLILATRISEKGYALIIFVMASIHVLIWTDIINKLD